MKRRISPLPAPAILAAPLLMALAGCHGSKPSPRAEGQRSAEGQVLKGSVSDAMLPYDALTSQPPLAPPPTRARPGKADSADSADSAADAAAPSAEAPTEAGAPAPEAPAA